MQTFLPYKSFLGSAAVLDDKRLGKQRVETLQIMKALTTGQGWIHHPATKMWAGYEAALMAYQIAVCEEWTRRGYEDTCLEKTWALFCEAGQPGSMAPPWLGNEQFHRSHKSNLRRKDPIKYLLWQYIPDDLEYVWPTKDLV